MTSNAVLRRADGVLRRVSMQAVPGRVARWDRASAPLAILIATPTHGNLGDHAIVQAEKRFLGDLGFGVIEVERFQYERLRGRIARAVRPRDLIVIDGGGNVGTLWPEENAKMNDIVVRFRDNPVVVFPPTAFFEDSELGRECRRDVASSYAKSPDLTFLSRDRATFEAMREVSPGTRNLYVPDIVLYLDESRDGCDRSGALLCLRDDKERALGDQAEASICSALTARGLTARRTSTVEACPARIDARSREAALDAKWDEFRSAEVVVTDRLHGMIFSAITGTPCVALDNVSRKVSQGHDWVRHIRNIKVADSPAGVPGLLDAVLEAGPCRYDRAPLDPYYDRIREVVLDAIG